MPFTLSPEERNKRNSMLTALFSQVRRYAASQKKLPQPRLSETVIGPRSGALLLWWDIYLNDALKIYDENTVSTFYPKCGWRVDNRGVNVAPYRGHMRIEANWPASMAVQSITLNPDDFENRSPWKQGRFAIGLNAVWKPVTISLDDQSPHMLVGGATGGGKTTAARSILVQAAMMPNMRIILVSGKGTRDIGSLSDVNNRQGPTATTRKDIANALWFAVQLCERRNRGEADNDYQLLVVLDDVQELLKQCPEIAAMVGRLARQGRSAGIRLVMLTQRTTQDMFADKSIKGQVANYVLALRTNNAQENRNLVGEAGDPPSHKLAGHGDGYVIGPKGYHRVQCFYVTPGIIRHYVGQPPVLQAWPDFDPTAFEYLENAGGAVYTPTQMTPEVLAAFWHGVRTGMSREQLRAITKFANDDYSRWRGYVEEAQAVYNKLASVRAGNDT